MKCTRARGERDFSDALDLNDGERLKAGFGLLVKMPEAHLSVVAGNDG
jgi:hypothetical protein